MSILFSCVWPPGGFLCHNRSLTSSSCSCAASLTHTALWRPSTAWSLRSSPLLLQCNGPSPCGRILSSELVECLKVSDPRVSPPLMGPFCSSSRLVANPLSGSLMPASFLPPHCLFWSGKSRASLTSSRASLPLIVKASVWSISRASRPPLSRPACFCPPTIFAASRTTLRPLS